MSIPDSNSVRVITPDEHVPTGFHEILIEDMGLKEWPKVPLSEIGCLRLDWPQEFFTFVGRYQLELEQMRKECRDRFEGISSGACPTCEKFIQNNLGRHVAMYHLDLAQLWRCPVGWCPVWKGTSQDCIDHMRRAHNTPITMKAGNLARWFPPWTVTREQWHNMSRPSVSGIAIDTFLFSRIGMSLFHQYRVFDRFGSHPAFRRAYMTNIFLFLKESDSEAIRRSHRRRARELAAGMSQPASVTRNVMSRTIQSGPAPQRTVVSNVMGQKAGTLLVTPAGGASGSSGISRNGRSREEDTVQALMDLSLPRFARLDDGRLPKTKLWPITEQPPSSPASVRDGNITRTPSPCYQLDDLTSASSTGGTVTNDYRLTLLTDSSNSITPVGSIVSFSDDDLPLESDQEDTRQVQRRDLDDDVPPGPSGVPEYIPLSGQKPVEDPIYTPTPSDKLVRVPISRVTPADENMFDPMLGEWPVDDLSSPEEMTRNKPAGGKSFHMTSYTGPAMVDADTRYGLQLHHPRFLEFIGAPESARLLNQSPSFWVDRLGQESAMAAAVNLQRDAGFMMTNLQILGQFVMSLHRMSAEMLSIGVDHVVFPVDEVDRLSVMPRAQRAAKYMSAMGLWRPLSGADTPGPLPVSTCTSCMQCESCFGRRGPSAQ